MTANTRDDRLSAPSTARNREAIFAVLAPLMPAAGVVLEIASGAGEHISGLASARPDLVFQPSDPDAAARASCDAWCRHLGLANMRPALALDASASDWPLDAADLISCINMIHISPWAATVGLFQGAQRLLPTGGLLYTYGPYRRDGVHTSEGNASFDQSLRAQNPAWSIRDVADLAALAQITGFTGPQIVEMPANNLSLIFECA